MRFAEKKDLQKSKPLRDINFSFVCLFAMQRILPLNLCARDLVEPVNFIFNVDPDVVNNNNKQIFVFDKTNATTKNKIKCL